MRQVLPLIGLVALVAACASGEATSPARVGRAGPEAEAGQAYAQRFCSRCHAIQAVGRSPNPASRPFRDIANVYSDVELSERLSDLQTGHYRMPPLAVSEADLKNLVVYLHLMRERTLVRPAHR
jgi:mono/diheme cytochrome c family protein